MTKTDQALTELIDELSSKIEISDFPEVRDACKDGEIREDDLKTLTSPKEWLKYLCDKSLLSSDDPSFIEHIFELCRRPDLLTIVMKYRLENLGIQDTDSLGKKLIRVRSAKKYTDTCQYNEEKPALKLSAPPKTRRQSSSAN